QHDQRHGQGRADPEAPRHVDELRVGPVADRNPLRLEGHAADRTAARTLLPDLRMHRTGIDGPLRRLRLRAPLRREPIEGRVGGELRAAAGRAEMPGRPFGLEAMLRGPRIDRHPADGIDDGPLPLVPVPVSMAAAAAAAAMPVRLILHRRAPSRRRRPEAPSPPTAMCLPYIPSGGM